LPRPRRSRRTLTTVLVLVLVSITIITIDQTGRTHNITSGVKSLASDIFTPMRNAVDDVLHPIGNFFAGAANYGSLQQENQKLQHSIGQLRQQVSAGSFERQQLEQLTALDHLPFVGAIPTVTAQTVSEQMSNFAATVGIDKGRGDGVDVGMPVVGAGGLVGQIVQSAHRSATVRLITDGQSRIGVAFGRSQTTATLDGQGAGDPMTLDFVAPGTTLHRGERLFTNGLQGGEFPKGIPVAFITSIRTVPGASQETVTAEPLANLNQLWYVDVLQWQPIP
jgi:rod shape-determining protein MreC